MYKIFTLGLTIFLLSCSTYTTHPLYTNLGIRYQSDPFKEIETATLSGLMIASHLNQSNHLVKIKIKKQLPPKTQQNLQLEFELPPKQNVEKTFFFQIDDQKHKFNFDAISYFSDVDEKTITDTDTCGASTTTTYRNQKKSVVLNFNIPDTISNKIITADTFLIRYYIDERPYELLFHAHPMLQVSKYKFSSSSYSHYSKYVSRPTSQSRPIELLLLKELLMIQSKADFQNCSQRYPSNTARL